MAVDSGFAPYAEVRRNFYGSNAGGLEARVAVAQTAKKLEQYGRARRRRKSTGIAAGIYITPAGRQWLRQYSQRTEPETARKFLTTVIYAMERRAYNKDDLEWASLLLLKNAIEEHPDPRFDAECERLFHAIKAELARSPRMLGATMGKVGTLEQWMAGWLQKPPGPPGARLPIIN